MDDTRKGMPADVLDELIRAAESMSARFPKDSASPCVIALRAALASAQQTEE